jgi:hypothetical protein
MEFISDGFIFDRKDIYNTGDINKEMKDDYKFDENIFSFINDSNKRQLLITANEILHIDKSLQNKIIFVYSAPKVGSTSIVSSLRLFGIDKFCVIHIHDEEMLRVMGNLSGITINEIILYNKYLGREVYVIDVFRCPIERKISTYFEKVGVYHFNNDDRLVNKYNVNKVINRFNKIFPHIGNGDHFIDKYRIPLPDNFDWNNKYLLIINNGINYIKLRLRDSDEWGFILTKLFGEKICIVKDYETSKKEIKDLYARFKNAYKIPKNLLDEVMETSYISYYFSPSEKEEYYNKWLLKSTENFKSYTSNEYKMYEDLTLENSHIDFIQLDHYMDEGCRCKACSFKRKNIVNRILKGLIVNDRVIHDVAKSELIKNRIEKIDIFNQSLAKTKVTITKSGKNFVGDMKNVVAGKFKY